MKRIIMLLLTIILVLPAFVYAGTYDTEVGKANSLLNKENFIHTYEKYIIHGGNIKFEYSGNENKFNSSFIRGGFISIEEFNLSKKKDVSYLFEGIEFWTLSKNGTNVYAITYSDTNTPKNPNTSYNGRATEFVNPNVKIHGQGKLNNPWTFDTIYRVTAVVDNKYATIESGNNVYVRGGCTAADCTANIVITPKSGYRYIANDCDGIYDETNHTLSVNNVKRDTKCNVSFGKGLFVVTLNKGTPNKIYLKYGENYYKELEAKTIIRKIESVEPKTGYTFVGYYHNNHKIINGIKEPSSDDYYKILYSSVTGKFITSDLTLEPTYEANQYKVIFNCNGGSTPPTTQTPTYDAQFTLTSDVCQRAGYTQPGWNTKADGTGDSWTVANHSNITWQIAHDVTLYAVWSACPAGTYSPASSNTCTACAAGTYNTGTGNTSCTNCSAGTYSAAGASSCTNCAAGTYSGEAASSCTDCGGGKWSSAGSASCSNIKAGCYGTSASNNCPNKCSAGKYSSAGSASCTNCGGGKWSSQESSSCSNIDAGCYGTNGTKSCPNTCGTGKYSAAGSSSCTDCPSGYTSDTKSTKIGDCYVNVSAGHKKSSSTGSGTTCCAKNTYRGAHKSYYGSSDSCYSCPAREPVTSGTCSTSSSDCYCLVGDTEIEVYDKKKKKRVRKKLKDITKDDLILCWDFDKGEYTYEKPLWIMRPLEGANTTTLTFSDGTTLKIVGDHRIYDVDRNLFVSGKEANIGLHTINSNGEIIELVNKEYKEEKETAYNVIVNKHINMFANGILTSQGSNNIYEFKDMKFVKEDREQFTDEELSDIDSTYVEGLRLKEWKVLDKGDRESTLKDMYEYIEKLNNNKK